MKPAEQDLYKQILVDKVLRRHLVKQSHYWFFHVYFAHYVTYETAPFQRELFAVTENEDIQNAVIVAFRGSAKSTIMTLGFPVWSIVGKLQKRFIVILSQTQQQSRLILTNIKQELETNDLLIHDFGPFYEDTEEWRANSLVIPQLGCRISAISSGESIRGIKHREYRPDLIICDDVEDLQSVSTREGRDKAFKWLTGDVLPAGDKHTKAIIIGNLLHEDSLIMRLKKQIEENKFSGIFREYPLLDDNGTILWPGKYPNQEAIEEEKQKIGSEVAWQREFLLNLVPDENQVVHREWFHYYDELPPANTLRYIATGIDLAIGEKESNDKTAMVPGAVYGYGDNETTYILPQIINRRMDFPETVECAKALSTTLGKGSTTKLFVEDVGYQRAFIQTLVASGYPAEEYKILGQDKWARLTLTTPSIKNARILFPRQGAEELLEQLTGYGIEKYDDLVDAFTTLILKIQEGTTPEPGITLIDLSSPIWNKVF